MSAVEYDEWRVFEHLFGPITAQERLEFMLASFMALQANLNTSGKRYTANDFLPRWDPQSREPEGSPVEDLIANVTRLQDAQDRRKAREPKER